MDSRIQIEIQTGYNSPWAGEFEKETISIGRAPTADVRMHPTKDTSSARDIHALVQRDSDGWKVTATHDSGVTVLDRSGKAVRRLANGESHRIEGELTFELGQGGPQICALTVGEALPATEVRQSGSAPLPVGRVSGDVVASAKRAPLMIAALGAIVVLVSGGLSYWIFAVRGQGQQIARQTQQQVESLRESIETGTRLTSSQIDSLQTSLTELREQPSDVLAQILVDASSSVWLTGVMDLETGAYEHGGTSWTVTEEHLATNAHVAEQIQNLLMMYPTSVPVALREGKRDQMIQLSTDMILHPGYTRWTDILSAQFREVPGGRVADVRFIPPCDVALLMPAEEGTSLGAPLTISSEVLSRSLVGDGVGSVGFPTENIAGLPSQQRVSGRITSQSDFLFQNADLDDAQLLHYSGVIAGGASGSPMLNEQGEVIGLVSAGSMVFVGGKRIPVGINYGQRVDLLQELLAGVADQRQSERSARWSERLREVLVSPERMLSRIASIELGDVPIISEDFLGTLSEAGIDHGYTVTVRIEPNTKYTLIGVSDEWLDVRMILLQGDTVVGRNFNPSWYAAINILPQPVEMEFTAVLYANDTVEQATPVRFRVVREAKSAE